MRRKQLGVFRWALILIAFALVTAACSSDSTETTEAGGTGDTTTTTAEAAEPTTTTPVAAETTTTAPAEPQKLLIWNKDDTDTFQELLSQFQESHPDVELKIVDRNFEDYDTAVALAIASDDPPDVLQVSYAYKAMGPFVTAGELTPLDTYADQYDWWDRLGPGAAGLSFSDDGQNYGKGSLYGVAAQGEVVGVFYNKEKTTALGIDVPTTYGEFEAALATAKAGGELPINLGGGSAWTLGQMYSTIQNSLVPAATTSGWVYVHEGATFDTAENIRAAQTIQDWADADYFSGDALGFTYPDSLASFSEGEGVFMFQGSWANAPLVEAGMEDNLGFFALPTEAGETQAVTSTFGAPWAIGANTASPNLAAEFIDFVTGDVAAELMAQAGNLPGNQKATTTKPTPGTSQESTWELWQLAVDDGIQVNFIGTAALNLGPIYNPGLQEIWAGIKTPEEWTAEVQAAHTEFHDERLGR